MQEKMSASIKQLEELKCDLLFGDTAGNDYFAGTDELASFEMLQGIGFMELAMRAFGKAHLLQTRALAASPYRGLS